MNLLNIAVIMACHNRKEFTLQCLRILFNQIGINSVFTLDVFLLDDNSTDGTSEEIKKEFSCVNISQGNGKLFWNRGMHMAWKSAIESGKQFDFFLWLNDDTFLFLNAFQLMLKDAEETDFKSIICGSTCSPINQTKMTYGGISLIGIKYKQNFPNGKFCLADIINGNCVLIPYSVYSIVGNLDWSFRHAIGDHDYSLRAKKLGIYSYSTGSFVGTCSHNTSLPQWCNPEFSILERIKNLYSPLGYAEPLTFFKYQKRHFGVFNAIKCFLSTHLRLLFPKIWL